MNEKFKLRTMAMLCALLFFALLDTTAKAQSSSDTIASNTATVDGMKIHYLSAGKGPAVILLHGYTQTSRMWRPLIEKLEDKFTVVAPDLPGIGDSDIPARHLNRRCRGALQLRWVIKPDILRPELIPNRDARKSGDRECLA